MNRLNETSLSLTLLNGVIDPHDYAEFLKAQYQIFYTIESKFGLPASDMFRADLVLDDLAEIGVENLQSDLLSVLGYVNYLKTLEWEAVIPHIIVNYKFLTEAGQTIRHRVPGHGRMYDFDSPKTLDWIKKVIQNLEYDEYADEVNYAVECVTTIHNEIIKTYTYE